MLTALQCLWLSDNLLGDPCAEALSRYLRGCSALTELELGNNNLQGLGMRHLVPVLTSLSSLRLLSLNTNPRIGAQGVHILAQAGPGCPQLTSLDLQNVQMAAAPAPADMGHAMAAVLEAYASLQVLVAASNSIGDEGASRIAEVLGGNTALNQLDLSSNSITDAGALCFRDAGAGSSLTMLDLNSNRISDRAFHELAAERQLELRGLGSQGS